MGGRRKTSRFLIAVLLGLFGTGGAAVAWQAGVLDRLEWVAGDYRTRAAAFARASGSVAMVEIDDTSIESVGRWPWPREKIAGLIDVLTECGAETITLDILFPAPQEVRFVSAAAQSQHTSEAVGGLRPEPVNDDLILAEALARSGRVLLSMHLDPSVELQPEVATTPASPEARLRQRSIAALNHLAMDPSAAREIRPDHLLTGRITPPLVVFGRGAAGIGFVNTEPDSDGVVRRISLLARTEAGVHPQLAVASSARSFEGNLNLVDTGDEMRLGNHRVDIDRHGRMVIAWLPADAPRIRVSAARVLRAWQMGKDLDGLNEHRRMLAVQLLRLVRFDNTDLEDQRWEVTDGLQARLHDLSERRFRAEYRTHLGHLYGPDDPSLAAEATALAREESLLKTRQFEAADTLVAMLSDEETLAKAVATAAAIPSAAAQMPVPAGQVPAYAARLMEQLACLPQLRDRLKTGREAIVTSLTGEVGGRLCLVGSTSTGAPDFVTTPVAPLVPGMRVHSDIIESLLSGRFVRTARPWLNLLVIVAAGATVTLLAAWRPVTSAGPIALLLAGLFVTANIWAVFGRWQTELTLAAPVLAMLTAFVLVTAWRQLTEEREKRWVRGVLAHTMSPMLVEQVEQNPQLLQLGGERRELTCMFSDLAGFTPLAERLGPQRTVRLLNHYFDHVSDVVQERCGGYLNKFLGDGIFVFFGAPIFQGDHAQRAMFAAVEYIDEVQTLNAELARELSQAGALSVRIGLATGEAMVGNCGSTDRTDYTAIGDCVNLASRLDGANKFFGTNILVSEATWQAGGSDALVQRPLGQVSVQGVGEAVRVRHILGRTGAVDVSVASAAADFAEGMLLFEARRFSEAKERFQQARAALPEDRAVQLYLDLCEQYEASPPPADWPGHVIDIAK